MVRPDGTPALCLLSRAGLAFWAVVGKLAQLERYPGVPHLGSAEGKKAEYLRWGFIVGVWTHLRG